MNTATTLTRGQKAAATRAANKAAKLAQAAIDHPHASRKQLAEYAKLEAGIDRAPTNEEAAAGPEVQIDDDEREPATEVIPLGAPLVPDAEPTTGYTGPMLALRERLAAGAYQKAKNGQPCCGDEIAIALGSLTPAQVIRACIVAMNLPNNPYTHLNVGQQSMNLRNKLRGCMKRGEFGMGVVVEAVEVVVETDQA